VGERVQAAMAHTDGKIHDTDLVVAMVRPLAWGS
jgi:hypothetical protein